MKKKTYIKEGAYQKVPNNKGTKIKGALDFNKEVLDVLVDKDLALTNDCCKYFPSAPVIGQVESLGDSYSEEDFPFDIDIPIYGMFILENSNNEGDWGLFIREREGDYVAIYIND